MSNNVSPSTWSEAGYAPVPGGRCRHGLIAAICRECDADCGPMLAEMACADEEPWLVAQDECRRRGACRAPDAAPTGAAAALAALAVVFALGVLLGWLLGGVGR